MRAALEAEALKLARSAVARIATVAIVVVVPVLAVGFAAAAEHGGTSALALKVRPLVPGTGWDAVTGTTGQVLTVASLLATGFVVSWTFGREITQGTIEPLLTSLPSRAAVVTAKLGVVTGWAAAAGTASVGVAVLLGLALGPDAGSPWPGFTRAVTGAVLAALLALPCALVATWGRDALAGVGTVLGMVVVTQVFTVVGAGAWFPWAAPSLWLGMGGPDVHVSGWQLAAAPAVAAASWWATATWWRRAELVSR
ncbi:ABC transporter permease [Cellulosimicrobium protaetiae]|uniref:ABC transporter permease subunit n=1 Tax=Cellulosimicrobium protaetiae TaxID=2587808 RepID=A0A6M5U9U3_9MICO|nr:ABC transporter permease [Cellulosimicrobium protaetiae]QJW35000.1 ABC transporter permease subunit [Cellulosimicrobium protaetiae]